MKHMEDLSAKLKTLPDNPGVYIMLNAEGNIIYVGKAKILKNRVRQYFHSSVKTDKVMKMVEKIHDFTYIITATEKEALDLEANLIKKHKPYYNILLKDDKAYPYIKVDLSERYPAFSLTRKVKSDKCKYFGPLMAGVRYKDLFEILSICFKVRTCRLNIEKAPKSHRPCLNYHLGRCMAPCKGYVSEEEYGMQIAKALKFLQGDQEEAKRILSAKMAAAAQNEDFETAMIYRDRLNMLERMKDKVISTLTKEVDMDVFQYASNDRSGALSLMIVRGGKIVGNENYMLDVSHMSEEEIYSGFLMQYYKGGVLIPQEIVIGGEETEGLSEALTKLAGYKVNIVRPKGGVRMQLLDMAGKNAFEFLEKNIDDEKRKQAMTTGAVYALMDYLGLSEPPRRMECYDISNISGTDKVSSMVVFFDGEPLKSHYRRFRIKTVEGANDFASMKETLLRRLAHLNAEEKDPSFSSKPDLIVVDGGKGQLSYAGEALKESQKDLRLISLAKREEEVFVPGRDAPIIIPKTSVALKLLQRIRDESHRFAITYHRAVRGSHMLNSELDGIEGVGEKRKVELIRKFKSLSKLKEADVKEIADTAGIGEKLAKKIKEQLSSNEI